MSDVGVLDKCVEILELISANPLSGKEIKDRVSMSRSTCYRLIQSLEQHRFIERTSNGKYKLGSFPASAPTAQVHEVLEGVRNVTGESTQLWMLCGEVRACVMSVESLNELRISKSPGSALPIKAGGSAALALQGPLDANEAFITKGARQAGIGSVSVGFAAGAESFAICVSFPLSRLDSNSEAVFVTQTRIAAQRLTGGLTASDSIEMLRAVARASRVQ